MITAWMIKYNFYNDAQISLFQNIVSVLIWQDGILETKQKKGTIFSKSFHNVYNSKICSEGMNSRSMIC